MQRTSRPEAGAWCAVLALALAGCEQPVERYPPPEQRPSLPVEEPQVLKSYIRMNEPGASLHFVRDIRPAVESGTWRWTGPNPVVKLVPARDRRMKLVVELTVPEVSFRATGPVTITVKIDQRELAHFDFSAPGSRTIQAVVPDGWLRANEENLVALRVDKIYVAGPDHVQLGFLLTSIGFVE